MAHVLLAFACPMLVSASADGDAAFNFLVMGDWGGSGSHPYTTPEEIATAAGMGKVAGERGSKFALALGDNFYSKGITTNEYDMRFEHTFEKVFTSSNLMGDDYFRVLLGNHDHYGNVTAQVEYSKHSKRWRMDDLYYAFEETVPAYTNGDTEVAANASATVKFVMIDTVTLAGVGHELDEITGEYRTPHGDQLPGPADEEFANKQWEWIEDQLQSANASDYLIVAGHYPVYSICEHGPTSTLVKQLKPMLDKYRATMFINGHDHCQEHIEVDGISYHTIGSAHENDPSTAHKSKIPKDSLKFHEGSGKGGFGLVSIDGSGLVVQHMAGDGKVVYTAPALAPRSSNPKPPSPTPPGPKPPTPGPSPTPPSSGWECHSKTTTSNAMGLDDKDNKKPSTMADCQQKCLGIKDCSVVVFHNKDKHCHNLVGAVTHDAYEKSLQKDSTHDTCIYNK